MGADVALAAVAELEAGLAALHARVAPLRLGIIGIGLAVEQLQWSAVQRMPGRFRVVAFCDLNQPPRCPRPAPDRAAIHLRRGKSGTRG